jgi:hypothetical protein
MKRTLMMLLLFVVSIAAEDRTGIYLVNQLRWGYPSWEFKVDGQRIKVTRNHYVFVPLSVGEHELASKHNKPLKITVTETPSYYTIDEKGLGWGGFHLNRMSDEDGQFQVSNMQESK